MQIPKLVNFDEVCIITGQLEIGIIFKKQIGDVVQVGKPCEGRRFNPILLAKFVTKQAGGFVHVVNKPCVFRRGICDMMVNDDPIRPVKTRFKCEVGDPCGFFAQLALSPEIIVIRLQRNLRIKKFFGELLQQCAREQSIEIAFVREDHFRFRQRRHDG